MKFSQQKFRIILGLMLIIGLFSLHNTGYLGNTNSVGDDQYLNADDLRTSGTYLNITIDNLPGSSNNWAWAENQVWCSGSGTLLEPYIIEGHILNMSLTADGLKIYNSHNKYFIVRNCTFKWNELTNTIPMTGIHLLNTTHGRIEDNLIYHLGYGIVLEDCVNINITGNNIYDHSDGISLVNSTLNNIIGNIANDNTRAGIYSANSDYNNITGNTASGNNNGIFLEDQNDNNIITGNVFSNNSIGIEAYYSDFNTIVENTANNNDNYGISLEQSYNNTISGNTVYNNTQFGFRLIETSCYNILSRNNIDDNQDGIFIYVALNNTIINNTIRNNIRGIHIDEDSDYNEFTENIIDNNTIGININSLNDNNKVYKNFFLNNGQHAYDADTDSKWNSSAIGNYWDNHTGPDTSPQDGIVDNPYTFIGGPAGSIDYLPIAEDGDPRINITSPQEGGKFGSIAPSFMVEVIDLYVVEMWYTIDGGSHNYTFTGNGLINQTAWDSLLDGTVTIRFYARDIIGNTGFEEVTIIKDTSAEGPDPGVIALIVVLSVIGGIVLLGAIFWVLVKKGKISLEKIKEFSFWRK